MSIMGMRDSDEEHARDGHSVPELSSFSFQNYDVTGDSRRKNRRGQLHKSDDEEKPEVEKAFICAQPGCPRTFSSKFKLVRHVLIHSGERRFHCNRCGRRFHRKDHLKNHLQVHNPNKTLHTCSLCRKTYSSHLSFRKHIALHSAEAGDLNCKLCGKVLDSRENILYHVKVHNGSRTMRGNVERRFPCDRCEKAFFTKKDVKRHLVVHTGKRDFVCQFCPQRFGRKDHLVRHTKKSHSIDEANSPPAPADGLPKYDSHSAILKENMKTGSLIVPSPMSDISRLVISPPTVPPLMESPVIESTKQDSYLSPPANIVQSAFGINHLPHENGQNLGRFSEPALLPVSQYLPMNPSYPGITQIMPHHYINMSTSSSMLSDLLPPMSAAPPYSTSMTLDMGNPPLPHFSQAFQ